MFFTQCFLSLLLYTGVHVFMYDLQLSVFESLSSVNFFPVNPTLLLLWHYHFYHFHLSSLFSHAKLLLSVYFQKNGSLNLAKVHKTGQLTVLLSLVPRHAPDLCANLFFFFALFCGLLISHGPCQAWVVWRHLLCRQHGLSCKMPDIKSWGVIKLL